MASFARDFSKSGGEAASRRPCLTSMTGKRDLEAVWTGDLLASSLVAVMLAISTQYQGRGAFGMLHVIKSADRFDPYRAAAPWICGFEEQLGAATRLRPQEGAWSTLIPGLAAARRRATLARWRNGPLAWRKWADTVQALQAEPAP